MKARAWLKDWRTYWRWGGVALLLGLALVCVMLSSDEELSSATSASRKEVIYQAQVDLISLPKIEIKSIQTSPFQTQIFAHLSLNGIEQRVLVGQQLGHELSVKSIDAKGVEILHHQQMHRYELLPSSLEQAKVEHDRIAVKASVELLSHEFHTTREGLEVYSATQQGLSASLGLQNGDRVSRINGEAVLQPDDITRVLKNYHPRQTLEFVGIRQGQVTTWKFQAQAED